MPSSRRRFLGFLGVTGGAGLAGCTIVGDWRDGPSMEPGPGVWPSYQNDRRNSGHADATGPSAPLSERRFRSGSSGSPAVVDDTVYVTSGVIVEAFETADGGHNWEFSGAGPGPWRNPPLATGTPAVADGTVYVTSVPEWTLYALGAADGVEQWRYEFGESSGWGSPTVVDGTIYVGGGGVHALSAADGTERWSFDPVSDATSAPTVVDGTVYVGSRNGTVYALSTNDGSEQWRYDTGEAVRAAPTVVDGTVYVGTGATYENRQPNQRDPHRVLALAAADGAERWTFETDHEVVASAAVADGTVYIGSWDEHVYAVSAADGTEQWRHRLNGRVEYGAPVVADGTVYVGSLAPRDKGDDILYALAASDGTEQWTFKTKRFWIMSPAVVDDTIYLGPTALE